uniref:Uncharacterized protein n=1 Tax=Anguilla anguilla TaxID=7936 RepID=A0A0E9UDV1_ANGAN
MSLLLSFRVFFLNMPTYVTCFVMLCIMNFMEVEGNNIFLSSQLICVCWKMTDGIFQ